MTHALSSWFGSARVITVSGATDVPRPSAGYSFFSLNVTTSGTSVSITDAARHYVGWKNYLFFNLSETNTVDIKDAAGNTIGTLGTNALGILSCTDNTSVAGVWNLSSQEAGLTASVPDEQLIAVGGSGADTTRGVFIYDFAGNTWASGLPVVAASEWDDCQASRKGSLVYVAVHSSQTLRSWSYDAVTTLASSSGSHRFTPFVNSAGRLLLYRLSSPAAEYDAVGNSWSDLSTTPTEQFKGGCGSGPATAPDVMLLRSAGAQDNSIHRNGPSGQDAYTIIADRPGTDAYNDAGCGALGDEDTIYALMGGSSNGSVRFDYCHEWSLTGASWTSRLACPDAGRGQGSFKSALYETRLMYGAGRFDSVADNSCYEYDSLVNTHTARAGVDIGYTGSAGTQTAKNYHVNHWTLGSSTGV